MNISKTAETGATNTAEALIGKVPDTMTAVQQRTSLAIGEQISFTAGRVEITLQRTEHTYTVTTYQGGTLRIEDNCGAYATEDEARLVARGYAQMYKAEAGSPSIAQVVPAGTHRQVRPTMAGAQLAKVTESQAGILAVAHMLGGTIRRSKDATDRQLRALARKGLVTLNYEAGRGLRRVVESATLTGRGQQMAQVA